MAAISVLQNRQPACLDLSVIPRASAQRIPAGEERLKGLKGKMVGSLQSFLASDLEEICHLNLFFAAFAALADFHMAGSAPGWDFFFSQDRLHMGQQIVLSVLIFGAERDGEKKQVGRCGNLGSRGLAVDTGGTAAGMAEQLPGEKKLPR